MHAFIVRPFGTKNGIDFDRVERELIRPALDHFNISGGTTVEFIQQGNIRTDIWAEISAADLIMLTATKPNRVGRAYKKALADAQDFERDSARKQLLLYQRLGILTENTQAALDNIPAEV